MMNKKPGLLFAVSLFAIIILASYFNMDLGGSAPVQLQPGVNPDNVLYICPADNSAWTQIAEALKFFHRYMYLFFSFAVIVLMFSWGWAFYQNLLKDKFNEEPYKNSWNLTKAVFWLAVISTLVMVTPNRFRRVEFKGHGDNWVLCENTSDGAKAVNPGSIRLP